MNFSTSTLLVGFVLMLMQLLAALPWLAVVFLSSADVARLRKQPFSTWLLQRLGIGLAICAIVPVVVLTFVQDRESLEIVGRAAAALLQLQITLDLFIAGFGLVLWLWPKGGAVALAAFREG